MPEVLSLGFRLKFWRFLKMLSPHSPVYDWEKGIFYQESFPGSLTLHPYTGHLWEESGSGFTHRPVLGWRKEQELPQYSSSLQPEELFEPINCHMHQPADHLSNTTVYQYFYSRGSSKLALVLKTLSLKCQIEGINYFLRLAGYSLKSTDKSSKINWFLPTRWQQNVSMLFIYGALTKELC